jgi:multiple sugar transport system permease protein
MKRLEKQTGEKVVFASLKYFSLIIITVISVAPILLAIITSFKSKNEVYDLGVLVLPEKLHFENYATAFINGNMVSGFRNTLIMVIVSLTGAILNASMVAYVLSRFDFVGKKLLKNAFLFASVVPSMTIQVMLYQAISTLGIYNTRMAGFLLYIGTDVIAIYIFLQQLDTIPKSLDESAMLDGASYLTIFIKIIMPLLTPAIATLAIIKGVSIYNDFYTPYLYMPKNKLRVIATSLFQFKGQFGTQWEVICAGVMITIIPVLVIFIALQKYIYNGLTQGSIK